jgi:predicted nucleic acid-binding protein
MPFVVDASIVGAWLLPGERAPETDALLQRTAAEDALAPDLLWHELRSVIVGAIRRGRIAEADLDPILAALRSVALRNVADGEAAAVIRLALHHRLSSYDATYLAVALVQQLPLATLDRQLRRAAKTEGIPLLPQVP